MNNYVPPEKRLSLVTCKKILKRNGVQHTDEEIIKIRDWFYVLADIAAWVRNWVRDGAYE
jgi:hypothetical protein